jgi:hypothetical protein
VFYVMGVAADYTGLANSGVGELLELLNVDGRKQGPTPWWSTDLRTRRLRTELKTSPDPAVRLPLRDVRLV